MGLREVGRGKARAAATNTTEVEPMAETPSRIVPCRLCATPIARDARRCPYCGVKEPWIADEPTLSPRTLRVLAWGGGIVLVGLLLFVSGALMFGPAEGEHDHRLQDAQDAHESR